MGSWFEDGELWADFAPLMFDGKRWAEVPAVIDGLDALLAGLGGPRVRPGLRVLDSCCGPGRHSLELARRGCAVTGIDITDSYLEAARESAAADATAGAADPGSRPIEFLHADVRRFSRPAAFDLALNLFTSFGYFDSAEEDLEALRRLRGNLAPGGALVLELIGKECASRDFVEGEWFERDGLLALTEYRVGGAWEYLENRWIVVREGTRFERRFRQRLYSALELESALREAGFRGTIRFHGGPDGSPYDQKAASLLALALGDG